MKILQITSGLNVNGALMYCKFLSEQLQQFDHQVTVLGRPASWLQENLDPAIPWKQSELNRHPAELKRIADWICQQQFDVIHTHMSRAHTFGVLMRMMTGIPVVATAHQCSLQLHWRLNSHVIANSDWTKRYQRRVNWVPARKLDTVHCFTDLQRFHSVQPRDVAVVRGELRLAGDEFVAGVVGDVVAHKGHWYLFQALQQIVEAVPNFQLVLLGRFHRREAYVKRLRGLQIKHALFQRVKWLGVRTNIPDFLAAFDMCIVPSVEESLGLVALEALAAGTPVIATDTGGLPEIIESGVNGILVPPRSPQHLAEQVIALAQDPQRRQEFAKAGKRLVASSFNPVELARQVESIFFRLAEGRQAA